MGRHALHLAAEANSAAAVEFLLSDIGVSISLPTVSTHNTALHFSAKVCRIMCMIAFCMKPMTTNVL